MIDDSADHVIVYSGHGHFKVFDCTLENAQRLLAKNLENLDPTVARCASLLALPPEERPVWIEESLMQHALAEVLALSEYPPGVRATYDLDKLLRGPKSTPSKDAEQPQEGGVTPVRATPAMRDELVLWAYSKTVNVDHLTRMSADKFNELKPHESLSFLAPLRERVTRPILYTSAQVWRIAKDLRQLQAGSWKPEAKLSRVVGRYLDFVQSELSYRDERLAVVERYPQVD